MFMKLPTGVTSISIGEGGPAEEIMPGIVDISDEHVAEARRHGLVECDAAVIKDDGGDDLTKKTNAELISILEEKGVELPAKVTKAILIDLIAESEKGNE